MEGERKLKRRGGMGSSAAGRAQHSQDILASQRENTRNGSTRTTRSYRLL